MKRAQVFKKTLLSVAVVTALGGNVSLSYSAETLESMKVSESVLQEGVKPSLLSDLAGQIVKFGEGDSKAALAGEMQSMLVREGGDIKEKIKTFKTKNEFEKKEEAYNEAVKAHKDAVERDKKTKKVLLDKAEKEFNGVKKALLDEEKKLIGKLFKDLNTKAGVSLYELVAAKPDDNKGGSPEKPPEPQFRAKPQEAVVAPTVIPEGSKAPDGKSVGADKVLVLKKGATEDEKGKFGKDVDAVVEKINELKNEDIKAFFAHPDIEDKTKDVLNASVTIKDVNLANDKVREAFAQKIAAGSRFKDGSGEQPALDFTGGSGTGISFKNKQLVLENVNNTFERGSVITDVSSSADAKQRSQSVANAKQHPQGVYVLKGDGKGEGLYHDNIGSTRALEGFKVENQKARVKDGGEVKAQHVVIDQGGSLAGYTVVDMKDKDGNVTGKAAKDTYVKLTAAMPSDPLVKDKDGKVIGRQDSTVTINSDETQRINIGGYETLNISGKEVFSQEINVQSANFTKGEVIFEVEGAANNKIYLSANTLTVGKDAVVKAVQEVELADPNDNTKKTKVTRDALVSVKGKKIERQKEVSKNGGKTWENDSSNTIVDRNYTVDGTVMANIDEIDTLTVSGTLVSDAIGSKGNRLNSVSLKGEGAKIVRFSNEGNTIYTNEKAEYVLGAGQEIINDIDGFKSFHLNGGVFGGNLTPSPVPDGYKTNKDAFQGSAVHLTSGVIKGGTLKSAKDIIIDGGVTFKAEATELASYTEENKLASTKQGQIVLDGNVVLKPSAKPVIHKNLKDKDGNLVTPVQWAKNATMEDGAELPVYVNLSEEAKDSVVPYVTVGETLTVSDKSSIRVVVGDDSDYKVTRDLYAKVESDKEGKGKDFAIVDAKKIEGKLGAPVASSKLLKASVSDSAKKEGREVYSVNINYNTGVMDELRKEYDLNSSQTAVVGELERAALTTSNEKAGAEVHKLVRTAIVNGSVKQFANKNTQNNVINGGLAQSALTVHRKVNENISRRLDRTRTGISSGDMFESQGFWGQYFYSDGSQDGKGEALGFDSKVNGLTLGVDADLNPDLTAGLVFSYAKSKLNTTGVSDESKSDVYMGSVYSGWNSGPYFVDGMLSYAGSRNDLVRDKNKAEGVKGSMWGARVVGGYMHQIQQWSLQPQAEFNYSNVKLDEYSEIGTATRQAVKVSDYSVMELGAGLKVFGEFDSGRGTIKPEASFMAYHDFKDDKPAGSYRLAAVDLTNWNVLQGGNREQNRYAFGVGGTYAIDNNLSLGLNYDYNWNGSFKAHGFMARISYEF